MVERTRHYRTATKDSLTPRQREVLQMVADGKTNPEIAERLGITLDGAKFHIREILAKLEVSSREEADGGAFSIAVEPGPNNTYPPIGITFWEGALPGDGEQAETTFGTALYRRVTAR